MTPTILPLPTADGLGTSEGHQEADSVDVVDLDVDVLIASTRELWNNRPTVTPNEREDLLVELIDLDLALERLSMRARSASLDESDVREISACSYRLGRLRRYWATSGT